MRAWPRVVCRLLCIEGVRGGGFHYTASSRVGVGVGARLYSTGHQQDKGASNGSMILIGRPPTYVNLISPFAFHIHCGTCKAVMKLFLFFKGSCR